MLLLQSSLCSGSYLRPTLCFLFQKQVCFPSSAPVSSGSFLDNVTLIFLAQAEGTQRADKAAAAACQRRGKRCVCVPRLSDVRWKTLATSSVWAASERMEGEEGRPAESSGERESARPHGPQLQCSACRFPALRV